MKSALVVRHVGFEDLGSFAPPLSRAGYAARYLDIGIDPLAGIDPLTDDLLVVLGGPIGVCDADEYPFLDMEIALLTARLVAGRPVLGICLGAQLMAHCLGGSIRPMGFKEIGWAPVSLTPQGRASPLRYLDGVPVLHWHGDSFTLPDGCDLLASTPLCETQAFSRGPNVLALQFHSEAVRIEPWLIGHACELATAGIAPNSLRDGATPVLPEAAAALLDDWLANLEPV